MASKLMGSNKFPTFERSNLNRYVLADSGFFCVNDVLVCRAPFSASTQHINLSWIEKLQEEKKSDMLLCVICTVNQRDVVYMPCCHFSTCTICSKKIKECPICRTFIESTKKVFLS